MALIGILSDSHGEQLRTRQAIQLLKDAGCTKIIHLGDVETLEVLDELAGNQVSLVFGNCDYVSRLHEYAMELGIEVQHPVGTIELGDYSIGFLHGDRAYHLQELLDDPMVEVIFYGK